MVTAPDGVTDTDGMGYTRTLIVLLVTDAGDAHAALEMTIHFTALPGARPEVVKAGLLVPVLAPVICHW